LDLITASEYKDALHACADMDDLHDLRACIAMMDLDDLRACIAMMDLLVSRILTAPRRLAEYDACTLKAEMRAMRRALDLKNEMWRAMYDLKTEMRRAKGPRTPTRGGPYDGSLGVGVPPDSPPKPVSFGFCFSGNTGGGVFFILYIAVNSIFFLNFLNDGRSMADSQATSRVTLSTGINRRDAVASRDVAASGGPTGRTPSMCCREVVARRL